MLQSKAPKRTAVHDLVYRRLLACQLCGTTLIGEIQKGRAYYRCHTKDCPTTTVRGDVVDAHIVELLSNVRFSTEDRRLFDEELAATINDRADSDRERDRARTLRRTQIDTRLARLTDAYLENAFDTAEFQRRKTALELERRQLNEPSATDLEAFAPEDVRFYLELAQRPSLLYRVAFADDKRDLVKIVTSNRGVTGRTPRFQLAIPFSDLAGPAENQSGDPSCSAPRTRRQIRSLLKRWISKLPLRDETAEQQRQDRLARLQQLVARPEGTKPEPIYVPIEESSEEGELPMIKAA